MQFEVRALTQGDHIVQLNVDAQTEEDALHQIKARGWFVSSIKPASKNWSALKKSPFQAKFSLLLFSQELLALLSAGLSIVESLEALLEKETNPSIKSILSTLQEGLKEGKRFSQVLSEQGDHFPFLFVGVIQASERTSSLTASLTRFIEYQQRIHLIRNKIISAMIYPAILMIVGGAVSIFLMTYVVPKFADVYRGTGRALPWSSQILLDWGGFVSANGKSILLGAVILISLTLSVIRQAWKTGGFLRLLGYLPGFGESIRIYSLSRLYLTLGMLLDGGVPIVTALSTVENVVAADMRQSLQNSKVAIQDGVMLSTTFESNQLTTPISLRLLRVGEKTGELGNMLTQSANFYDGEISRWIDRFIRGFEPLLMAVIGLVVGVIVVLLYMPIFNLADGLA